MPSLVIVCGPPATGKSSLAAALGKQLRMPVISKDLIKEAMMDHLGGPPAVGAATFSVQFAIARELLDSGMSVILEGAFFRAQSEIVDLARRASAVVVEVSCRPDLIEERYIERHPTRRSGHRGLEALPDLRRRVANGEYGVPDLGRPALSVDSTDGFKPSPTEVAAWVREHIEGAGYRALPERVDLRSAWQEKATHWIAWARKPGFDSYWRFGRAAFFELLPPPGLRTLDVGCGEGRLSRDLVALGHHVVSIDASTEMVRAAAAVAPNIPAVAADAAALPIVDGCCDLVIAYMSLHDMADMESGVREMARTLAPGGRICIAIVHPINSAGEFEGMDPEPEFIIRGSYLQSHPYVDTIKRDGMTMTFTSMHRPLGDFFDALEAAAMVVEALKEIPVDKASAGAAPRRERWRRLPMFLALRAVKR